MWKDVKGWEQYYEINEHGEVRNKKTMRTIVGDINNAGYRRVCLYNIRNNPQKQRFFVHRLVANHFIDNPNGLPEINHIDCDINNNDFSNLEWISRKDNERHSMKFGRKKFTPLIVCYSDGTTITYETASDFANEIGLSRGAIHHWLHGKNTGYKKYKISSINYL